MPSRDWFRNTDWNDETQSQFFAKLNKARSQSDQYLVIQALTLAKTEPRACLELVDFYFDSRTNDFDEVRALLARAEAYEALGEMDRCISSYKSVLAREIEIPNHRTNTSVWLPYLIACKGLKNEYDFALELTDNAIDRLSFPIDHFHWHASRALILNDLGRVDDARNHAAGAVEAANIRRSGFRYHQDLGLVGGTDMSVVKQMYSLDA